MPKSTRCIYDGRKIGVNYALRLRDEARKTHTPYPKFNCVECDELVRPHRDGEGQAAHFEHRKKNPPCHLSVK